MIRSSVTDDAVHSRTDPLGHTRLRLQSLAQRMCLIATMAFLPVTTVMAENIALGKPYRLVPAPNYKACTEPGDAVQLTDGVKKSSHWLHLSTVGWKDSAAAPSVQIDLGSILPIDGVRVHTVGGGHAGVYSPAQIVVMVSDDGETFHVADVLDRSRVTRPVNPRRMPQVLRIDGLHTRGRFVHITCVAFRRYVFLDEIEILRGAHDAAEVTFAASNRFHSDQVREVLKSVRTHRRLGDQIEALKQAAAGVETSSALQDEIAALATDCASTPSFLETRVQRLDERMRATRGRWLAQRWGKGFSWHPANPMIQHRSEAVLRRPAREGEHFLIEGWREEYETAAVNLVNASAEKAEVAVSFSPLRSATGRLETWGDRLVLRFAAEVDTPGAGAIGDALVRVANGRCAVEAGSARQLFLTAYLHDLEAGDYDFSLRIDRIAPSGADETFTIPARLTVHAPTFPRQTSLFTFNWGYLSRLGFEGDALRRVVRDLETHHTNVYVVPGTEMPQRKRGADGAMEVDFRRFDAALDRYPRARRYLFWWGYKEGRVGRHGFGTFMSPAWQVSMREYLVAWVAHLQARGLSYDRFAMYPFDESLCDEFLQLARFIKRVDPNIAVFANSIGTGRIAQIDRFSPFVDIWCLPERKRQSKTVREHLKQTADAEIWRYNATGHAKSLSPYSYYRLQPWRAWAAGDRGCAFWFYATGHDRQACNGWDDFTCGRGRWSVVYDGADAPVDTGGEPLVPSRRWEAWREGIEDYEYLHTLSALIDVAREGGVAAVTCSHVRFVLAEIVADVLANPDDADKVYEARRRLTAEIVHLRQRLHDGAR